MTFKKVEWFYIIIVDGAQRGTVQKEKNKWQSVGKDGWIYYGNTRREAAENMLGGVR